MSEGLSAESKDHSLAVAPRPFFESARLVTRQSLYYISPMPDDNTAPSRGGYLSAVRTVVIKLGSQLLSDKGVQTRAA